MSEQNVKTVTMGVVLSLLILAFSCTPEKPSEKAQVTPMQRCAGNLNMARTSFCTELAKKYNTQEKEEENDEER